MKKEEKIRLALNSLMDMDGRMKILKERGILKKPLFFYKIDYIRCALMYKASPNDYFVYQMYAKNHLQNTNLVTYKKHEILDRTLNNYDADIERIGNKAEFNRYMQENVKRDWIYSNEVTEEEILSFFEKYTDVFFKPTNACCGKGICRLNWDSEADRRFLKEHINEEFLLEEPIKQHRDIQKINPYAVNSLRVNSLLSRDGNETIILQVSLKVSIGRSCVDNMAAGGYVYPVNWHTGRIEQVGISHSECSAPKRHPLTGERIVGAEIPNMDKIIKAVEKSAKMFPEFRYLGWDIAVTEDGYEFIEVNTSPEAKILQSDGMGKYLQIKANI